MIRLVVNGNWLCWYNETEMALAMADFNYFAENSEGNVRLEQNGRVILETTA